MAAPTSEDETKRLAALEQYHILDTGTEDIYDDLVRLAAFICDVPVAAVTLVADHRQWFKSILGLDVTEVSRDVSFCTHTILQSDLLVVPDTQSDSRFADNPFVTGTAAIRFYAGVPLVTEQGHALGSLCVLDRIPRKLTLLQEDALRTLARRVMAHMEMTHRMVELTHHVAVQEDMKVDSEELNAKHERTIEAQRAAIEAQRAAGQSTQAALNGLSSGIAILEEDGTIQAVNQAWRQFAAEDAPIKQEKLSLIQNAAEGANYLQVCDRATGAETEEAHAAAAGIRAVISGERSIFMLEYSCHSPEVQRWFVLRATRLSGNGSGQVIIAHENVTERKQAEVDLRQSNHALQRNQEKLVQNQEKLVEAQLICGLGDWELEVATGHFTWSRGMFHLMEFNPAEGTPSYEIVMARDHPGDRVRHDSLFTHAVETGEPFQYDLRLLLPSGTPRGCHLVGRPSVDAAGTVVRVVGTLLDITERLAREQRVLDSNLFLEVQKAQLETANAELETANAELAALATTDPLTGLLNHRAFQARLAVETARAERGGTPLAVVMMDLDNFKFFNDAYGHITGDMVLRQVAERLRQVCRAYDTVARFGGDEFALLMPGVGQSTEAEIRARLRADLSGLVCHPSEEEKIPINVSVGVALFTEASADHHETLRQADERLLRDKTGGGVETEAGRVRVRIGRSVSGFSMLDALVTAVDNKDRYTRRHSEDVLDFSLLIARGLGMDEALLETIGVAALLHDVGKIGVPDAILRKPGKLTEEEFAAIKQHPMMGAVIVQAVPGLEETLDAVRHHHERWDGAGYPFGLRGAGTPLMARLMAVADAYSAMTTDRPYRQSMGQEKALSILSVGSGSQWDPVCVEVFVDAITS